MEVRWCWGGFLRVYIWGFGYIGGCYGACVDTMFKLSGWRLGINILLPVSKKKFDTDRENQRYLYILMVYLQESKYSKSVV